VKAPVSVIILTFNEEANIEHALRSVAPFAEEVFVVDSGSADRTADIARRHTPHVVEHPFENYSAQRNWALDHLPVTQPWVMFLDADETIPGALWREIAETLSVPDRPEAGFFMNRKFIFLGRWLRFGGFSPTWILRLFRRGKGRYEPRPVNEHAVVDGPAGYFREPFLHEDRKDLSAWLARHNRYTTMEAEELMKGEREGNLPMALFGSQPERKRFLRYKIWNRLPFHGLLRFLYTYVFRLGFLDGRAGFHFAVLISGVEYLTALKAYEKRLRASAAPPEDAAR
jgi:glycosyltransferase involved in cell wall biosynthesis